MNVSPQTKRFFVGIELDAAARNACAAVAARLRATDFSAAFENAEKFHLTLAFLGNVDAVRSGEIKDAMRRAASGIEAFELTLDRIGAFPHERSPRVVYIGARQQGAYFRNAARIVRSEYAGLGFAFNDDAVAHVTVGRVKGTASSGPPPAIDVAPISIQVVELALFESTFDPSKRSTRYEIAARASLAARAPIRPRLAGLRSQAGAAEAPAASARSAYGTLAGGGTLVADFPKYDWNSVAVGMQLVPDEAIKLALTNAQNVDAMFAAWENVWKQGMQSMGLPTDEMLAQSKMLREVLLGFYKAEAIRRGISEA
jgi:2'-5' RNA ligase